MLRRLISVFRSSDPLREMGDNFTEMLGIAEELSLRAGKMFFGGEASPEERSWIYDNDVRVNQLQREIRKQVITHLSLSGNTLDLPYCLLLISLVKDVERIGDYAKNLIEIGDFFTGPLPDDELFAELGQIRNGVDSTFAGLAQLLGGSSQEAALVLIHQGKELVRRCDSLVVRAAQSSHDAAATVAVVLGTRYYKRIGAHLLNILSSVVMPLHKVDYYDEVSMPPELKTQG